VSIICKNYRPVWWPDTLRLALLRLQEIQCLRSEFFLNFLVRRTTSQTSSHTFRLNSKKVKLSSYLHVRDKGKRRYSSCSLLTLAVEEVSGQRHSPAGLYPRTRTQSIGGRIGLTAYLDTEARGKNSLPLLGIEPHSSSLQLGTILTGLPQLQIKIQMTSLFIVFLNPMWNYK
jgi:hypothetical protein